MLVIVLVTPALRVHTMGFGVFALCTIRFFVVIVFWPFRCCVVVDCVDVGMSGDWELLWCRVFVIDD